MTPVEIAEQLLRELGESADLNEEERDIITDAIWDAFSAGRRRAEAAPSAHGDPPPVVPLHLFNLRRRSAPRGEGTP